MTITINNRTFYKSLILPGEVEIAMRLPINDKLRFWHLCKQRAAGYDVQSEIEKLLM